jgi:hypothetical protein
MDKVKLPKLVAESIGNLLSANYTWTKDDLFYVILNPNKTIPKEEFLVDVNVLRGYAKSRELLLARALINGYEVEQTPEDKVRDRYEFYISCEDRKERGRAMGIKEALDILGKQIKGVND